MKCKNNCKRCGCPTCCECGPLRPLKHLADAMFYVCKAMGPPMDIEFRHRVSNGWSRTETRIGATDATPLWWEWHDAAQKWVSR